MNLYPDILAVTVFILLLIDVVENVQEVGKIGMDQSSFCASDSIKLFLVEDKRHIIVLGRNTPVNSPNAAPSCRIAFGPSGTEQKSWYLRLRFESFYINQCDVLVKILQSPSTMFETKVEELINLECNMRPPEFLYTKKDHYLLISLVRPDQYARNYQYRLNVSLSEGPVEAGLSTPVVAIVGVGVLLVLCLLVCLLTKYAVHMKEVWREKRAERAIEHASRLYHSSSHDFDEPHLHLVQPPPRTGCSSNTYTAGPQSDTVCVVYRHSEGTRGGNMNQVQIQRQRHSSGTPHPPVSDNLEPEDLPPSYEEALEMPLPDSPYASEKSGEPLYANT